MSDQTSQPQPMADLDDAIATMVDQASGAPGASGSATAVAFEAPAPSAPGHAPAGPTPSSAARPSSAPAALAGADSLLGEIATDIEQHAPGALPTAPPPPDAKQISAGFTAPTFEPPAPALAPKPAPSARQSGELQRLDETLAAQAETVLAEAQKDLEPAEHLPADTSSLTLATMAAKHPVSIRAAFAKTSAAAPKPPPAAPADDTPAPVAPAPTPQPKPEALAARPAEPPATAVPAPAAPLPAAAPAPTPAPAPAAATHTAPHPVSELFALAANKLAALLHGPLAPLSALGARFSESTRQTIGYCAVVTLFFALCVWGRVLVFPPHFSAEPTTPGREFYDDTKPAHGVTAPPKHEEAKEPSHEGAKPEAGGHGEEKKEDEHGKPEAKPSPRRSAGGAASADHGEKKTASSRSRKAPAAKPDEHAGH